MQDEYLVIQNQDVDCSKVIEKIKNLDKKEISKDKDKEYEEIFISGVLVHCYSIGTKDECDVYYNKQDEDIKKCLLVISLDEAKEKYPAID